MQLSSTKQEHTLNFRFDPQKLVELFSCPVVIKHKNNAIAFSNELYKKVLGDHNRKVSEQKGNKTPHHAQYESLTDANDLLFWDRTLDHNTEESYIDQNGVIQSFDVSRSFIDEQQSNDYIIKIFNPISLATTPNNQPPASDVNDAVTQPFSDILKQSTVEAILNRAIHETDSAYCSIAFIQNSTGTLVKYLWAESDHPISDDTQFIFPVSNTNIWKETYSRMEPIINNSHVSEDVDLNTENPFATTRYISIPFLINDMTVVISLFDKDEPYDEHDTHKLLEVLNTLKAVLTTSSNRKNYIQSQTYQQTINSVSESIIIVDLAGNILTLNNAAQEITRWNYNTATSFDIKTILRPEYEIPKTPQLLFPFSSEWYGFFKNLKDEVLELNGKTLKMKGANGDHTGYILIFSKGENESILFWKKITNTHKMESIGILAGGMAHDFNNFLTGIHNYVNLSKLCTANRQVNKYLDDATLIIDSARVLTKQFLLYSKQTEPIQTIVKIDNLLHSSSRVLFSGTNIKAIHNIDKNLWLCEIDESQIGQAIGSIIINARESMPEGGYVEISAENVDIKTSNDLSLANGHYVKIGIKDNGKGIPDNIKDQIFNPFFSTKSKNTGLGLTSALFMVKSHYGNITFSSDAKNGTEFIIYLPAITDSIESSTVSESKVQSAGKILLMDDEHYIRFTTSELLKKKNFEVVVTSDGNETLRMYKKAMADRAPFDVVILDLTIPDGMGGVDTLKELLKIDPDVKAIASSGYSDDPIMSQPKNTGFHASLCKPYRLKEFLNLISNVISS